MPTDTITKLIELIYAGAKLVSNKIGIHSQKTQTEIQNQDGKRG